MLRFLQFQKPPNYQLIAFLPVRLLPQQFPSLCLQFLIILLFLLQKVPPEFQIRFSEDTLLRMEKLRVIDLLEFLDLLRQTYLLFGFSRQFQTVPHPLCSLLRSS